MTGRACDSSWAAPNGATQRRELLLLLVRGARGRRWEVGEDARDDRRDLGHVRFVGEAVRGPADPDEFLLLHVVDLDPQHALVILVDGYIVAAAVAPVA